MESVADNNNDMDASKKTADKFYAGKSSTRFVSVLAGLFALAYLSLSFFIFSNFAEFNDASRQFIQLYKGYGVQGSENLTIENAMATVRLAGGYAITMAALGVICTVGLFVGKNWARKLWLFSIFTATVVAIYLVMPMTLQVKAAGPQFILSGIHLILLGLSIPILIRQPGRISGNA